MTDRQIYDIAFHHRDDKGNITPRIKQVDLALTETLTLDEERFQFYAAGRAFGIPQNRLDEAWNQRLSQVS